MIKALLSICIAVSLGAVVLGYLNMGKLMGTRDDLDKATSQLSTAQGQLETAQKEVKSKNEELAKVSSEKDQLKAEAGEAKSNLEKAKAEATEAIEKAKSLETELATTKTDNEAKDKEIAELKNSGAGGATAGGAESGATEGADIKALQTELDETKTLLVAAQDRNTGLEAQISEYARKEQARQKSQMRQGIQGTILAVNQAWNFVVLSIGDRQGVVNNAEMLIQRGSQLIGKVRVTSVEPSTSIADVVVRTVPRGFSVMPGDTVIYPAQNSRN